LKISSHIAKRYFFSKSSSNAVNIITGISVAGILVGSAALIIVLSAFNGLENLVRGFYEDFDPDLKIVPHSGKFFQESAVDSVLESQAGIISYAKVLEEKALFSFRDKEFIASLKGVDQQYSSVTNIRSKIPYGEYRLNENLAVNSAVIGAGVAYYLGFSRSDFQEPINIFIPKESSGLGDQSFRSDRLFPLGFFSVQPEFDEQYVLSSLDFSREVLNRPQACSAVELAIDSSYNIESVQENLKRRLPGFEVLNREEQQASFLKVMRTEGLFTFLIFALILSIATFTIAGSLTMLMFEKRGNLHTLWSMGTSISELRKVILKLGMIISLSGGIGGLLIGALVVIAQEHFQLISVGEGYIVDAYPVALRWTDLMIVAVTVLGLGYLSAWLSARRLNLKLLKS